MKSPIYTATHPPFRPYGPDSTGPSLQARLGPVEWAQPAFEQEMLPDDPRHRRGCGVARLRDALGLRGRLSGVQGAAALLIRRMDAVAAVYRRSAGFWATKKGAHMARWSGPTSF